MTMTLAYIAGKKEGAICAAFDKDDGDYPREYADEEILNGYNDEEGGETEYVRGWRNAYNGLHG